MVAERYASFDFCYNYFYSFYKQNKLSKLADEKNLAIVVTLHDIELALRIADKMALIKNHRVVAYGYPENVMKRDVVNNLYDLKNANYSEVIGYFELKSSPKKNKRVFVICGGGTGANVLRYLVKNRYEVVVGILHKNDADYFIAEAMGVKIIAEEAYNRISEETFNRALTELGLSDVVVYTDFPIGEINHLNLRLIEEAKSLGKEVIYYDNDISVLRGI